VPFTDTRWQAVHYCCSYLVYNFNLHYGCVVLTLIVVRVSFIIVALISVAPKSPLRPLTLSFRCPLLCSLWLVHVSSFASDKYPIISFWIKGTIIFLPSILQWKMVILYMTNKIDKFILLISRLECNTMSSLK